LASKDAKDNVVITDNISMNRSKKIVSTRPHELPFEVLEKLSGRKIRAMRKLLALVHKTSNDREREEVLRAVGELISSPKYAKFVDPRAKTNPKTVERLLDYRKRIGEAIRCRRRILDMTQEQLATETGLEQSHVSRLESGFHVPTSRTISLVAKALGINANLLDPSFSNRDSSGAREKHLV
jgi:ribosome-binding protein aMBF1 (putative translation factor)